MNKAVRVLTYDNVNVVFSESLLIPYVFSYFVSHTSDVTVCVECGHECGVPRPRGGKRGTVGDGRGVSAVGRDPGCWWRAGGGTRSGSIHGAGRGCTCMCRTSIILYKHVHMVLDKLRVKLTFSNRALNSSNENLSKARPRRKRVGGFGILGLLVRPDSLTQTRTRGSTETR